MRIKAVICLVLLAALVGACTYKSENPFEVPTPPPAPGATPLAKLELKRDAELEAAIAKIAPEAKGKVGVAAIVLETGEAALLNADDRFPMQSVYKLPISMAVMDQVRREKLELDEKVGVTNEDMVRAGMRSPLRDENPNGGEFAIRELIRLAMVESDGTASDVLMRVAGGATEIQSYLTQIGIRDMKVVNTEKEMGRDWETQYENWSTPVASIELLRWLHGTYVESGRTSDARCSEALGGVECTRTMNGYETFYSFMIGSATGPLRLKGQLPKEVSVAHKTGSGGNRNGITSATNDIGIINLSIGPDLAKRNHLAIAVFVSDSPADEKTREAVIAKIAKACWDRWNVPAKP
ncbi:MAG: serine hydrolase [Pyrinomonadaceae bacterium]